MLLYNTIDTYIIRIDSEPISVELANDLVKTLELFNINYNFFDAVYGDKIEKLWNQEELFFYPKQNQKKQLDGVRGCFLSHYLLWKECLNKNKPLLIFEHDALLIRSLDFNNILEHDFDVLNLDHASRVVTDYNSYCETDYGYNILKVPSLDVNKKGYARFNKASVKGVHAYIIKPNGAKKLLDFTKEYGTLPADIQINSVILDYYYTQTTFARVNPTYWSQTKSINSFTRKT